MITVEIGVQNGEVRTDEIEIYFDKEGLNYLLHRLGHIRAGTTDHVHLMSESWGLDDLAESAYRPGNKIAHHLRMTLVEIDLTK